MRRRIKRKAQILLTLFLVLLVFGVGSRIVQAEEGETEETEALTEEETDALQEEVQDALIGEFDFGQIEDSLDSMFPEEKISFQELVSAPRYPGSGPPGGSWR